jgi:hypothetical protein
MKYFIDTEFIEGKQDKTFLGYKYGETKPTIDLISIGIVSDMLPTCPGDKLNDKEYKLIGTQETGIGFQREYYAISKDFNLKQAWNNEWVRENVLKPILVELQVIYNKETGFTKDGWEYNDLKYLLNKYGKTNKQIAKEIVEFTKCDCQKGIQQSYDHYNSKGICTNNPEFYAYYADYDWVVFCQLFGTMMDLPKGFPMYCIDLKQTLDEKATSFTSRELSNMAHPDCKHNVFELLGNSKFNLTNLKCLQSHVNYPKQTNEHNALADAKWNYELYKFLNTL